MASWQDISIEEYMQYARCIEVIWLRGFGNTNTRFRKVLIKSDEDFSQLLKDAYLPWYYDNLGADCNYDHPNAKNFTVKSWVERREEHVVPIRDKLKPIPIVTAYDTILNKRLIVDGCNRCVALAKYGINHAKSSEVTLLEAYSNSIRKVFTFDFINILEVCIYVLPENRNDQIRYSMIAWCEQTQSLQALLQTSIHNQGEG